MFDSAAKARENEKATGTTDDMSERMATEAELRAQLAEAPSEAKLASALGEMRSEFGNFHNKFGELNAEFGYMRAKLDAVERSTSGLRSTVITTGLTAAVGTVAIVIGVLAYGQTWFGIGVSTSDVIKASVSEYRQQQETAGPQSPAPK